MIDEREIVLNGYGCQYWPKNGRELLKKVARICLKFLRFCPQCKAYFSRIPVGDPWCVGVNHMVGQ